MSRFAPCCALFLVLSAAACAATKAPRTAAGPSARQGCSSFAQPDVSAATTQRLERAANLIEYEGIWRAEHPGTATGTIGGSEVRAQIRANAAQIRDCYEAALDHLPGGGGRVAVRFVIDSSGRVPTVSITSNELRAPDVGCCVAERVGRWSFPSPTNGGFVVVEYPFVVHVSKGK
jgi:hypothetical protein